MNKLLEAGEAVNGGQQINQDSISYEELCKLIRKHFPSVASSLDCDFPDLNRQDHADGDATSFVHENGIAPSDV